MTHIGCVWHHARMMYFLDNRGMFAANRACLGRFFLPGDYHHAPGLALFGVNTGYAGLLAELLVCYRS